jgi:hypothetical protein
MSWRSPPPLAGASAPAPVLLLPLAGRAQSASSSYGDEGAPIDARAYELELRTVTVTEGDMSDWQASIDDIRAFVDTARTSGCAPMYPALHVWVPLAGMLIRNDRVVVLPSSPVDEYVKLAGIARCLESFVLDSFHHLEYVCSDVLLWKNWIATLIEWTLSGIESNLRRHSQNTTLAARVCWLAMHLKPITTRRRSDAFQPRLLDDHFVNPEPPSYLFALDDSREFNAIGLSAFERDGVDAFRFAPSFDDTFRTTRYFGDLLTVHIAVYDYDTDLTDEIANKDEPVYMHKKAAGWLAPAPATIVKQIRAALKECIETFGNDQKQYVLQRVYAWHTIAIDSRAVVNDVCSAASLRRKRRVVFDALQHLRTKIEALDLREDASDYFTTMMKGVLALVDDAEHGFLMRTRASKYVLDQAIAQARANAMKRKYYWIGNNSVATGRLPIDALRARLWELGASHA